MRRETGGDESPSLILLKTNLGSVNIFESKPSEIETDGCVCACVGPTAVSAFLKSVKTRGEAIEMNGKTVEKKERISRGLRSKQEKVVYKCEEGEMKKEEIKDQIERRNEILEKEE